MNQSIPFFPLVRPQPKRDRYPKKLPAGWSALPDIAHSLFRTDPPGLPASHYKPQNLVTIGNGAPGSVPSRRRLNTEEIARLLGIPFMMTLPERLTSRSYLSVVQPRVIAARQGSALLKAALLAGLTGMSVSVPLL